VLILIPVSGQRTGLIRLFSNLTTGLAFLLSCCLLMAFDAQDSAMQFSEFYPLNPKLGSAYALGVDGLALPMLVLATLLTAIAVLASRPIIFVS
jgi:NADH-quinone oxidoreductase subunit M